nr:enoyl-CoA hydratase-related protein [Bradyrhizobium sp. 200]
MLNDLTRLLIRVNEDRGVRCVILTGNGRAFCAGLDLRKERSGDGLSAASSRLRWTCATRRRPRYSAAAFAIAPACRLVTTTLMASSTRSRA